MTMPTMIRIAADDRVTHEVLSAILRSSQEYRNGLSQLSQVDEGFYYMVIEDFCVADAVLTALEDEDIIHTVIRQIDGDEMSASHLNLADSLQAAKPTWLTEVRELFTDWYALA